MVYVRKIKIIPGPRVEFGYRFEGISVRLGHTAATATADFSTYEELIYYVGPPSASSYFSLIIDVKPARMGRYISVQSMSTSQIQIGYVHSFTQTKQEFERLYLH